MHKALHDVTKINAVAGKHPTNPSENPGYFEELLDHIKVVKSELQELEDELHRGLIEGPTEDVMASIAKEAGDVEVTSLGVFVLGNLNYKEVMDELVRSLWTRFDEKDSAEFEDTRDYYERELGLPVNVKVYTDPDTDKAYSVLVTKEQMYGLDGKYYPRGKWLKSVHRTEFDVKQIDLSK